MEVIKKRLEELESLVNNQSQLIGQIQKEVSEVILNLQACLGMQMLKDDQGRLGYQIDVMNPQNMGALARIIRDVSALKGNGKSIVTPNGVVPKDLLIKR